MLFLPKPYPDEVIGSVIGRGCYQSGMPLKQMLRCLFDSSRSTVSFLMSWDLKRLGVLTGLDAEELLERHTMFPYSVAYMSASEQTRLRAKALKANITEDCLGALTKNISHGVLFRRICEDCIADDIAKYGEAYWHRAHHLPGVYLCTTHGTALQNTDIPLRGRTNTNFIGRPEGLRARVGSGRQGCAALREMQRISTEALNGQIRATDKWLYHYRSLAFRKGYEHPKGAITGQKLALDLGNFFGPTFLTDIGCAFSLSERNAWPALMVREGVPGPFTTPKHVLIQTFFLTADCSNGKFPYSRPGPKIRDFKQEDIQTAALIQAFLRRTKAGGARYTVTDLLVRAGVWQSFRHNRGFFPKTDAVLQTFRASDQSERQLGKRLCWRRKGTNVEPTAT
jgi:hypothetical protein